jgi:RNA polymerase sigma-70 factor (ECF subfamily)
MSREDSSFPSSVADVALLGKLFEQHQPKLLATVRRRLDPALAARLSAEDVLSDAFLEARRKWPAFKAQSALAPYPWLYRVVLDCLIQAWRRETRACRDPERELPWPERSSLQLVLGLVGSGSTPSDHVAQADLRQQVAETLKLLKDKDREVLWMRHHDDLSFPEVAAALGIAETAARVRYVRALERLRALWLRLHPEDRPPEE